jgi:phage terminase large subunit-like protein
MTWTTACPDWEDRLRRGESLIPFPPLFADEAEAARAVFDTLKIVDAPGSPTMGECCRPWVFDFCDAIFGAYNHEIGRRMIREFFLLISKKNAKSTIAAGIMLTALVRNWRQSAEFLILAPTIEIANNSFFPARDMVRHDEELSALFHVQDHYRTITHLNTGATLKIVAADNETVGGKKAVGVLVDEVWLFGKKPNAENMLREATGGLASRPEGFIIYLSTQSDEPPAGVFRQKLQYARQVRDGVVRNPRFLPVLYEFPEKMIEAGQHKNPANFYITNPNLGASVDETFLLDEMEKADLAGPESMRGFLSKHLNVEIGLALRSDRWAGADFWEAQAERKLTLEALLARSEVVTVGIDGGGLDDLLGVAVLGREIETRRWLLWNRAYCSPIALERRKSEAARYRDLEASGDLVIVDGLPDDIDEAVGIVQTVRDAGILAGVGLDQIGLGGIVDALADIGVTQEAGQVFGIAQGWRQANAIKTLERKLADGTLVHAGQPLMAWCVGNAKVEPRGNAISITKQAAGAGKIDPLVASFNAAELMSKNPQAERSFWQLLEASGA